MSPRSNTTFAAVFALAILAACSAPESPPRADALVDDSRLRASDADVGNWLMYGRTYDEHRYSPLTQIDADTVGSLGLVWHLELDTTRGLEATPLVNDGVIYTTSSWSIVYAIDAASGAIRWSYDPQVDRPRVARFICCDVVNRGVALYDDKVYVGTLDGRLVALDAATGTPVWDVSTIDTSKPYAITGYPRIADGKVLIGNAGAEYGVRGYVSAYDAQSGERLWRSYTVPGDPSQGFESDAMERAAATWHDEWWIAGGGGTVWEGIVYDPALDYIYFGTGNPTAWYRALRSDEQGDNLYVASILALRASDGAYVWHFQTTPNDNWDFDATQPLMLADLAIDGRDRRVIMQASKNGFFYVLDRATGEFISGEQFVDGVTWATHLDRATGRPVESPSAFMGTEAVIVSPGPRGAHNWNPMAFNPLTGLVYLGAKVATQSLHAPDPEWMYDRNRTNIGRDGDYDGPLLAVLDALPPPHGELVAWNPVAQRAAWRVVHPTVDSGGVLATAGNLIFQGRGDGMFIAYRASDGEKLWEFDAGTGIMAPPVTYLVDGVQQVSVMVGLGGPEGLFNLPGDGPVRFGNGRLVTFALGKDAAFEPRPFGHAGPPTPAITLEATPDTVARGEALYASQCRRCHGTQAIAGPLPDLRYATEGVHQQFEAIVLGGALAPLGMPAFDDLLTGEDVRAIQAYVLARAAQSQ